MYRNFLFLIYLFFVPVLNADVLFENLTNTVKENFPSRYYGLAITDINNDGNFDLIVSNFEGTNFYYSQEPDFVENFNDATLSFTSSVTKNSLDRVITKTFVISATASINSIYNSLTFSEKINVSSTVGANNTVLKQINKLRLDVIEANFQKVSLEEIFRKITSDNNSK